MSPAERKRERLYWTLKLWGPAWVERLVLFAVTVLLVLSLVSFSHQQDHIRGLTVTIQQERAKATFDACHDQNVRHDRTVARLRVLAARASSGGRSRAQRRQSLAATVGLIDVLAPHQDCDALVHQRVTTPKP